MVSLGAYIDYPRWSELAERAFRIDISIPERLSVESRELVYSKKFKGIVISGMGGSGIAGDIVRDSVQEYLNIPIIVNKDLKLPTYVDNDYLVIAISYSGNTRETIRCYEYCIKNGIPVVSISTGGKLRELAEKYKTPHITIEKVTAPRYGLPCLLYSTLRVIGKILNIEDKISDIAEDSINYIRKAVEDYDRKFKRLCEHLLNKYVMIYTPSPLSSLGIRFKNDMNENAKQPVTVCIIPESEHNDLAIHVRDFPNLEIMIVKSRTLLNTEYNVHIEALCKVLEEYNRKYVTIELEGSNILSEIMYGITGLGMLTIDLAKLAGIDPVKIEAIDRVKKYVTG